MASVNLPPLPPDLKSTLPNPKTPWNLSPDLFRRIKTEGVEKGQSPDKTHYKTVDVVPTDPEYDFVLKYFGHHKPQGYGIKRIYCIHNPAHTASFEAGIKSMDEEIENSATFAPKWKEEDLPQERAKVHARWKVFTSQFSPVEMQVPGANPPRTDEYLRPKAVPMWHGSSKTVSKSVCGSNFTSFGKHHFFDSAAKGGNSSTDLGYFGSGIYFSNSAKYAAMYSPQGILILAWVSMREPYPVVSNVRHPNKCADMIKLEGKEHYQNYNAHYVPVASINPQNPNCMEYYPCFENQQPAWDELVVFHNSQTLPRFCIELGVDLPKPISLSIESKGKMSKVEEDKQIFLKYQENAKNNNAESQFNLGMCYLKGTGIAPISKEAVKWFQKAANLKYPKAAFQLGICHEKGIGVPVSPIEAFKWYCAAAELGFAEAESQVGVCYYKGIGVAIDQKAAVKWYQNAANHGFALAQYYLGSCFIHGNGTSVNLADGIKLWTQAATKGVIPAQYYLGKLYLEGIGVPKDEKEALKWFQKAADQGDTDAINQVKLLSKMASVSPLSINVASVSLTPEVKKIDPAEQFKLAEQQYALKNYAEAAKLYEKAANEGHAQAQCKLGALYYHAEGVTKDYKIAVEWYKKAERQNLPLAQYYLGSCYVHGNGTTKNVSEGIKLYIKAAEHGVRAAQYYLGKFYLEGNGVPKDEKEALRWFQLAAAQGDADARRIVDQLTKA